MQKPSTDDRQAGYDDALRDLAPFIPIWCICAAGIGFLVGLLF